MERLRGHLQFVLVAALLLTTRLFLHIAGGPESVVARQSLASFPKQQGSWTSQDLPLAPDVLEVLGPGDFLTRLYQSSGRPYINLFIAYFPSQRTGNTIHSPKNCLPGAGWVPVQSDRIRISTDRGRDFPVNQYLVAKGRERELVLYWYQARDRRVASEYWAKFYLVLDSIRLHRTDGALIRLVTPIVETEGVDNAQRRLVGFARQIIPFLGDYIPR